MQGRQSISVTLAIQPGELTALYGREGLELNACTSVKDGVTLEYLNGVTLEEYLDSLLMEDKLG